MPPSGSPPSEGLRDPCAVVMRIFSSHRPPTNGEPGLLLPGTVINLFAHYRLVLWFVMSEQSLDRPRPLRSKPTDPDYLRVTMTDRFWIPRLSIRELLYQRNGGAGN